MNVLLYDFVSAQVKYYKEPLVAEYLASPPVVYVYLTILFVPEYTGTEYTGLLHSLYHLHLWANSLHTQYTTNLTLPIYLYSYRYCDNILLAKALVLG